MTQTSPDLIEQKKEARVKKEAIEALLRSQGWDILRTIAESQVSLLTNQVMLTPVGDVGAGYKQEFDKGHVAGIRTFMAIPAQLLDEAQSILDSLAAIDEDDDA